MRSFSSFSAQTKSYQVRKSVTDFRPGRAGPCRAATLIEYHMHSNKTLSLRSVVRRQYVRSKTTHAASTEQSGPMFEKRRQRHKYGLLRTANLSKSHRHSRPDYETINKNNVVYKITCLEVSCNATFYGYMQKSLMKRVSPHMYKSSSIYTHFFMDHDSLLPKMLNLISNFEVIYSNPELITLKIAEPISIKYHNP